MAYHDLHIANSWTLATWVKPGRDTADETILDFRSASGNENRIRVEKLGTVANDPLQISLYDSAGALFKQYRYESVVPAGTWELVVFTWNGTTLTAYTAGASVAASSTPTNNAGTMSQTARSVTVGADYAHTAYYQGYIHSVGLWSSVLTADEVAKLYEIPTLWWRQDADAYVSSADLVHWWRLGEPTRHDFEGTTWVVDAGYEDDGIDLSVGAANVTDADIVAEVPSVELIVLGSLSFNGTNESLLNTTENDLGIANAWTIAFCLYRHEGDMSSPSADCWLWLREAAGNENRIDFGSAASGSSMHRISLYDSAGTLFKDYRYNNLSDGRGNRWERVAFSWDGTTLTYAINGRVTAATTLTVNNAGTMTNTNRRIGAMRDFTAANYQSGGFIGPVMWNEALTSSELEQLTSDMEHRDLSNDYGNYASSANLVHYWRPGVAPSGLQSGQSYITDYLNGAGVDIAANAENMADANFIAGDYPYLPSEDAHSISLDGSTEYIQNGSGDVNMWSGGANGFTIKFTVKSDRDTHDETILDHKATTDNNNRIIIQKLGTTANDPLRIVVYSFVGAIIKDYRYNSALPAGAWRTYTVTFNDTTDTLTLYNSAGATVTADTLTVDTTGAYTEGDARTITFGADHGGGSGYFQGQLRQVAFITDDIGATTVGEIAGHTADLHKQSANWLYVSAGIANLVHWFLFGKPDFSNVNVNDWITDYPGGATNSAITDWSASANVTSADIVAEIPS